MSSCDLFLTNTGDLSFSVIDFTARNDIFDFNFYIAPSQALLFNFMIDNNVFTTYDNKKKLRADVYVNDFDEIDSTESLKEGMKVHVARTRYPSSASSRKSDICFISNNSNFRCFV